MGTNTIPFLLKWIRFERTPLRRQMMQAAADLPFGARLNEMIWQPYFRAVCAAHAFEALGASASNAVPTLIGMLRNSSEPDTAWRASDALGWVGTPAVAPLVEVISDGRKPDREAAVNAFGHMRNLGTSGLPAVPLLLRLLTSPDANSRGLAARALGNIALEPQTVLPALVRILDDPDIRAREHATCALANFDQDAKFAIPKLLSNREKAEQDERSDIDSALFHIAPASYPDPDAKPSQ
jgi:HEAT repeat protein